MIELQYESKFDGFLVDLRVGPAEELNQAMFGGEPVFTYKRGATVSADTLAAETFGCLVWIERFDGSPESFATLFHELVHASTLRFEKSGVLRRTPKPKDVGKGLVSFDELVANSVGELGEAFLGALVDQGAAETAAPHAARTGCAPYREGRAAARSSARGVSVR